VLSSGRTKESHVETYDPQRDRWVCHRLDTIRQVEFGSVLLYRVLPDGILGPRLTLAACPGLAAEIRKQKPIGKRTRTDEEGFRFQEIHKRRCQIVIAAGESGSRQFGTFRVAPQPGEWPPTGFRYFDRVLVPQPGVPIYPSEAGDLNDRSGSWKDGLGTIVYRTAKTRDGAPRLELQVGSSRNNIEVCCVADSFIGGCFSSWVLSRSEN
jgi:hypothetical protein